MNAPLRYDANPDLSAMKQDIADRDYKLSLKSLFVTGAVIVAGAALGAAIIPLIFGSGASMLMMGLMAGGMAGLFAGPIVSDTLTLKDREKLKIDRNMVDSYMQGKNYWGAGYREEVAEYGYAGPQSPMPQGPAPARNSRQAER